MMVFEHDFDKFPELTNSQMETMELTSPHKQIKQDFFATVIKVIDGDTIRIEWSERDFDFPLRFLDIDAPEMNAGGDVAKEWLEGQILGEMVEIKINPENRVDKFGRLLGRVFSRGMDIGDAELRLGLATTFAQRREGQVPPFEKELTKWL